MLRTTRRSRRTAGLALLAGATLAVSGCGGLMSDGRTAATYGDTTVTTAQVQDAVKDVSRVAPQTGFDGQSAAIFLALRPKLNELAARYDLGVSRDQAEKALQPVADPSNAGIDAVQSNLTFGTLRDNPRSQTALATLVRSADIKLNPRYGRWSKGGPVEAGKLNNWLKQSSDS
ncbi:hypothetical protein PZ938_01840 [Luteipulveratus sp. YIM 133132]|uniref:Lipoprotein n=1 Tax=Luteipulveratus flavus TaxID=3031728 RepID=A0ABT6CCF5_9MICO|nr:MULTISPECIES: hypothetical protein [unclassified Luteipulveratus]MDE9364335.1 hypothetical protein [Luteipulveratus sp. YIM 133132]MDF8266451.1 hypothetical protein [Luteipulveratus sp. YIM 133296]